MASDTPVFINLRHDPHHTRRLMSIVKQDGYARTTTGRCLIYQVPELLSQIAEIPPRWVRDQITAWIDAGYVIDNYRRPFYIWDKEPTYLAILCLSTSGDQLYEQMWTDHWDRLLNGRHT